MKHLIIALLLFSTIGVKAQSKDSLFTITNTYFHPHNEYCSFLAEQGSHTWQIQFAYDAGNFPKVGDKVKVTPDEKHILINGKGFEVIRLTKKS